MSSLPEIRPLATIDEFRAAERVQREVWGFVDAEVVPLHVLLTAAKNGGVALGAFDPGDELVGVVFGFLGRDALGPKHCSHILGVVPSARRRGIGEALKWAQREHVLAGGIERMTWTFDPLLAGNARLNLHRLGAVCRRFEKNVYGEIRDDLNRGFPTDRFEVDWWLASESVARRAPRGAEGETVDRRHEAADVDRLPAAIDTRADGELRAATAWRVPEAATIRAEIPADFAALKRRSEGLARAWIDVSREAFPALFAAGFAAVDVATARGRAFYVLERDAPA